MTATPEQLFAENYRIAFTIMNRNPSWRHHVEQEDMEQISLLEVWRAANAFDHSRGLKFVTLAGTYVFLGIQREVHRHQAKHRGGAGGHRAKHKGQHRRRFSIFHESAEEGESLDLIDELTITTDIDAGLVEADRRELVRAIVAMMVPRLACAVWLEFIRGMSRHDAALAAGFENKRGYQSSFDQWKRRNFCKLRETFGDRVKELLA